MSSIKKAATDLLNEIAEDAKKALESYHKGDFETVKSLLESLSDGSYTASLQGRLVSAGKAEVTAVGILEDISRQFPGFDGDSEVSGADLVDAMSESLREAREAGIIHKKAKAMYAVADTIEEGLAKRFSDGPFEGMADAWVYSFRFDPHSTSMIFSIEPGTGIVKVATDEILYELEYNTVDPELVLKIVEGLLETDVDDDATPEYRQAMADLASLKSEAERIIEFRPKP